MSQQFDAGALARVLDRLAVKRDDEDAWNDLYKLLWPFVYAIVLRRLKTPAAAEEAAQDTFLRVSRYFPFEQRNGEELFKPYIARVAVNAAHSHWRRSQRQLPTEELGDHADPGADVEQDAIIAETLDRLMQSLPDADRRMLVARYVESASLPDMADRFGLRYSAVAVRLYRLQRRLLIFLKRTDV